MIDLPITPILDDLVQTLADTGMAVLQAPPGAGKTTLVPLAILQAGIVSGRILMLEPRRLAARAAAERMADVLGQSVGQQVGYRMRGDARVSNATRIEVVTEGILTRMIQQDPDLPDVDVVIFDEFHERSLNADLGLALCLEIRSALRMDLKLLVMSATLDAEPVAQLMGAPILTSEGRSYPVDMRWLEKPVPKGQRLSVGMAALIERALAENDGSLLAFLPGAGEIRQTESLLKGRVPKGCDVYPLYGAMDFAKQRAAIAPLKSGRKVVLATSIAETSLTIDGICIVVDGGRARRARFDPGAGMSRLVTERVTKAEATQRAGRAGRTEPGVCYKLWTKGEEGGLQPFPPPEIETVDLAGLALELAQWGAGPDQLPLLTPPNPGSYAKAQDLLQLLGALDSTRLTDHGKALARVPAHPRLAHMLVRAGSRAAMIAALLSDRDPFGGGSDLDHMLKALRRQDQKDRSLDRIRAGAKRLTRYAGDNKNLSDAQAVALAFPDRIALRRPGNAPRYLLSGGKGAVLDSTDALANQRLLVVPELDGDTREARILQAIATSEAELREIFEDQIAWQDHCIWSAKDRRVLAQSQERLGAIALSERRWKDAPPDQVAQAMLEGVRQLGLPRSDAARRFQARVGLLSDMPKMDETTLIDTAHDWLLPYLNGIETAAQWKGFDMLPALRGMLSYEQMQQLDRDVPAQFTTPLGRQIAIDYGSDPPEISLRLQEMFGQTQHPMVGARALKVTLLSPAGRPIQTTMDLPGFWAGSYADVRKDMRGRYPKHPWPEDPTQSDPTLRAKPRG